VILTRGDVDVGLDAALFWHDAAAFEAAFEAGRHVEALELYRGDLLPGFFVTGAPGFEEWLEDRRGWLRQAAVRAAAAAAEAHQRRGELADAVAAARRAFSLAPYDEAAAGQLFRLLDIAGDRAGALEAYARFEEWLMREYGARPSPETAALLEEMRGREHSHRPTTVIRPDETSPDSATGGLDEESPESGRGPNQANDSRRGWKLSLVLTTAIGATLVLTGLIQGLGGKVTPERRIVVLPLTNATGDSTLDYLAEGLAFSTASRLAHVSGLVPAAGARAPESARGDPRRAGFALRGEGVVAWSLERMDTALVVKAEIVRVSDGERLWACECPVGLFDFSSVEDQIVREVTERFAGSQPPELSPRPHGQSPASRLLYLKARYYWSKRSGVGFERALRLLEQAIDDDPGNAEAYAWLANTYGAMAVYGHVPPDEGFRRAQAAASRALELNDNLADSHSSVGAIRFLYGRDWIVAEQELRRAIALDPEFAEAHSVLAHMLRALGRYDDALLEAREAARLDPLAPYYEHHIGILQYCAGNASEAIRSLARSLEWDPGSAVARRALVGAWVLAGHPDSALQAWQNLAVLAGDTTVAKLVAAHRDEGYGATARAIGLAELEAAREASSSGQYVAPMRLARSHGQAGQRDETLDDLSRAISGRDPQVLYLWCDPALESVRGDARFEQIAERLGLQGRGIAAGASDRLQ